MGAADEDATVGSNMQTTSSGQLNVLKTLNTSPTCKLFGWARCMRPEESSSKSMEPSLDKVGPMRLRDDVQALTSLV